MVIDNVTSCLSPSVIGAYRSEIQEAAARVRAAAPRCERCHGCLMGANCRGVRHVCVCVWVRGGVPNMAHSTLCHVDDGGLWGL